MNNERFAVPELLFRPSDVGVQEMGITEALIHAVESTPQGKHINTQSTTQQCTLQTGQLRFGPYTILAWTAQSVNCHIALKAMFYLLINCDASKSYNLTFKTAFLRSKLMLI